MFGFFLLLYFYIDLSPDLYSEYIRKFSFNRWNIKLKVEVHIRIREVPGNCMIAKIFCENYVQAQVFSLIFLFKDEKWRYKKLSGQRRAK